MLWTLCYDYWGTDETKEEAVIEILGWTQSQRDFWEILEHMTIDGNSSGSYHDGHRILTNFLDGSERMKNNYKMPKSRPPERSQDCPSPPYPIDQSKRSLYWTEIVGDICHETISNIHSHPVFKQQLAPTILQIKNAAILKYGINMAVLNKSHRGQLMSHVMLPFIFVGN